MVNFFTRFKQIEDKKKTKSSIMDLSDAEKSEIDDQAAAGVASRDIANSLKIPVEIIYNYRRLRNQEAKKTDNPLKETLANKLQEREVLKADFELQKLKIELEQKQQELEMGKLEFQKDLAAWKKELKGEDSEEDNLGIKDLLGLIIGAMQKGNNPTPHIQTAGAVKLDPPIAAPAPDQTQESPHIELSDEQIRAMINELDKKLIKIAKVMPDNLLFDQIADKFPTLSDETINHAIEIFRKEY